MSAISNYEANRVLDFILGNGTPTTVYAALFTVTPSESGGGTEVSGGSYARVSITNNSTNWPAASGQNKANGAIITFPTATADWGTIVAFAIFDASSSGNMIAFGSLDTNRIILNGDGARFPVGTLNLSF